MPDGGLNPRQRNVRSAVVLLLGGMFERSMPAIDIVAVLLLIDPSDRTIIIVTAIKFRAVTLPRLVGTSLNVRPVVLFAFGS